MGMSLVVQTFYMTKNRVALLVSRTSQGTGKGFETRGLLYLFAGPGQAEKTTLMPRLASRCLMDSKCV